MGKHLRNRIETFFVFLIFMLLINCVFCSGAILSFYNERSSTTAMDFLDIFEFDVVEDSYICSNDPDKNFGNNEKLLVSEWAGGLQYSFLKFDLSSIPQNVIVISASLKLFYLERAGNPEGKTVDCFRVLGSWSESSITWNSMPSYSSIKSDSCVVPSDLGEWLIWDVTSDVRDFVNGFYGNYGWVLIGASWFDVLVGFGSEDSSVGNPILEVYFVENHPPGEPYDPFPVDGMTEVDVDVDLSWVCSDPDGDILVYDIYFGTGSNPGRIRSDHEDSFFRVEGLDGETEFFWYIIAKDPFGLACRSPTWSFITRYFNYPPVISRFKNWPEGINCTYGFFDTEFMFAVHYYDRNGNIPALKTVNVVDEAGNTFSYVMNGDGSDSDYFVKIFGSVFGGGFFKYYFLFHDGYVSSRFPDVGFWFFNVDNAPGKPLLNGPVRGGRDVDVVFSASSVDPEGDKVQYWFDWGDGGNSGWVPDEHVSSGVVVDVKHNFDRFGSFRVRVRARDFHGGEGVWSDEFSISISKNKEKSQISQINILKFKNLLDRYSAGLVHIILNLQIFKKLLIPKTW